MTRVIVIAAGTLAFAGAALAADRVATPPRSCVDALMPAYLDPAGLLALAGRDALPAFVVINPASGPGARPYAGYRAAAAALGAAGTNVLGYVPTAWGARREADVAADIDRYRDWYGVDGAFFDEAAASGTAVAYYAAAARHARGPVALNPGVVPARAYLDVADIVVTYEGPARDYAERVRTMPAWARGPRAAHLVYAASREQALAARDRGAAPYVYATTGVLPHPWGTLPPHLSEVGCR